MLALFLSAVHTAASASVRPHVAIRTHESSSRVGWTRSGLEAVDGAHPVRFSIFLQQDGLEGLDATFSAVSDPDSPRYGKFLSKTELDAMVYASRNAVAETRQWLAQFDATIDEHSDVLHVTTTARAASNMFQCEFHAYERREGDRVAGARVIAIGTDGGRLTVPKEVHQHIHLVTGLTELWHGRARSATKRDQAEDATDIKVTPAVLREYYGIPANESNLAGDKNLQAIAAFNDYYCAECLASFDTAFGEAVPTVEVQGVDCLDATKPCDQVESDLDMQYITSIGQGTKTLFYSAWRAIACAASVATATCRSLSPWHAPMSTLQ